MGRLITRSAGTAKILGTLQDTWEQAMARGGDIQAMAEGRLGGVRAGLDEVERKLTDAEKAELSQRHALRARDAESDLEVCAVLDEVHNTLGRPAQSVDFALIAGTGRQEWTRKDSRHQPQLMMVLAANLRSTASPMLQAGKEAWASRVETAAQAQQQAVDALDAAELAVTTLSMRRRALARAAQVMLSRFKRDLANTGMSQAKIHEIIPAAKRRTAEPEAAAPAPTDSSDPADSGSPETAAPASPDADDSAESESPESASPTAA